MRTEFLKEAIAQEFFMLHPKAMNGLEAFANQKTTNSGTVPEGNNSVKTSIMGNVGIIAIEGAMYKKSTVNMCMSVLAYSDMKTSITNIQSNSNIDTEVYIVDTPGGVVSDGADEVSELIRNSKNRTIAISRNMMASGGMWIFSACKEIYASSNLTEFGSIGVKGGFLEQTEDDRKIYRAVSKNAENKDCSLNGKCKEKLDTQLNTIEEEFYDRLKLNTGKDKEYFIKEFNKGDTIFAPKALEIGFIKGIVSTDNFIKTLVTEGTPTGVVPSQEKPAANQNTKEKAMANPEQEDAVAQATAQATQRAADIAAIGSKYGISAEAIHTAISTGQTIQDFQATALDDMQSKVEAERSEKADIQAKLDEAIKAGASEDEGATVVPKAEEQEDDKEAKAVLDAASTIEV